MAYVDMAKTLEFPEDETRDQEPTQHEEKVYSDPANFLPASRTRAGLAKLSGTGLRCLPSSSRTAAAPRISSSPSRLFMDRFRRAE